MAVFGEYNREMAGVAKAGDILCSMLSYISGHVRQSNEVFVIFLCDFIIL